MTIDLATGYLYDLALMSFIKINQAFDWFAPYKTFCRLISKSVLSLIDFFNNI